MRAKKADVCFETRFGAQRIKVAVECKNWERGLTRDDVKNILADYDPARQDKQINSIWIVCNRTPAPGAREYVGSYSHAQLMTVLELERSIIDFTPMLNLLVKEFENDTLSQYFISPNADGLAQLAEVGFFREVRVKGLDSMLTRTLVAARTRLVRITTELSNQIRGVMKTFGLVVPAGKGSTFEKNVRSLLADQDGLASIVLPMLEAWRGIRIRAAELGRQLVRDARQSQACRILMSIPGIGAITATAFTTAIERPDNFKKSRSVGAWIGLTTRRYQSGEVDYDGHISRRGDCHLRGPSLRSGGGHSDAQLNQQYSAHVGSEAPGENRLQKSCRGRGAQTGGYNAYDA